jgi:hypothetical protein
VYIKNRALAYFTKNIKLKAAIVGTDVGHGTRKAYILCN